MTLIEQLREQKTTSLKEAKTAYFNIIHRAAIRASDESDAAVLAELLPQLGKDAAAFDRDLRNYNEFIQAKQNMADIPTPEECSALCVEADKKAREMWTKIEEAQKNYQAALNDLHGCQGHNERRQMLNRAAKLAVDACGDWHPDFVPPAPQRPAFQSRLLQRPE